MVHSIRNTLAVNTIKHVAAKEYGSLKSDQAVSQLPVYTNDMRMEATFNTEYSSTYSFWSKAESGDFHFGSDNSHMGGVGYTSAINKFSLIQYIHVHVNPPSANVYYNSVWFFDVPANFTWNQSSWNHYCIVTTGYGINDKKIYVNGVEMPINPSWSFIHPSLTLFDRNAIISNHLSTYPCLYDNLAISNEALTPAAVAHIASNPEISLTTASGAYTSTFANSWNGKVDFEQANYVIDTNGHKIISTDIYGTYIHNLSYSDINLSSDTV